MAGLVLIWLLLTALVVTRFLRIAHGSAPFGSLRQRHHLPGILWAAPGASS